MIPTLDIPWRRTNLGQEVSRQRGLQTGPFGDELKASEYLAGGVPVILPRDLVAGTIEHDGKAAVAETKAAALDRYRLRPGDVLLARRGEVGRCALAAEQHTGWLCGTGCIRLRLDDGLEPRFLAQYLRWPRTLRWFSDRAVGQTMPSVNTRIVRSLPLLVPPPDHQRQLAEVLEGLDTSIALRRRLWAEELALHRALLCRLLGLPHAGPGSPLPPGWRWAPLGDLCTLINGNRFRSEQWSDAGVPILRIQNLNGSRQFKLFAGYAKPRWRVAPGDLLFAWSGVRSSLGPTLWQGPAGVLNQHIFRVEPAPWIEQRWLYEVLRELTAGFARQSQGFKSSLQHLRKSELARQQIPVPPVEEQRRVAEWSGRIAEQEERRRVACEAVEHMKQEVMDDLLVGPRQDDESETMEGDEE